MDTISRERLGGCMGRYDVNKTMMKKYFLLLFFAFLAVSASATNWVIADSTTYIYVKKGYGIYNAGTGNFAASTVSTDKVNKGNTGATLIGNIVGIKNGTPLGTSYNILYGTDTFTVNGVGTSTYTTVVKLYNAITGIIAAGGGGGASGNVNIVKVGGTGIGSTVPVSGTVTANNSSVSATGATVPASATMVGGTDGTNMRAIKTSATGVVSVDGSASTQPVSGTVTSNAGTGTFTVTGAGGSFPNVGITTNTAVNTNYADSLTTLNAVSSNGNGNIINMRDANGRQYMSGTFVITGTFTTSTVTTFQKYDGTNWNPLIVRLSNGLNTSLTANVVGDYDFDADNAVAVRANVSGSGLTTITVLVRRSAAVQNKTCQNVNVATQTNTFTTSGTNTINDPIHLLWKAWVTGHNDIKVITEADSVGSAQNSTTSGQMGLLIQGATTTSAPTYTTAKTNPLSLNTAGGLRVDGSAVTQPISGAVTVTSGNITTTGTIANTANDLPIFDSVLVPVGTLTSSYITPIVHTFTYPVHNLLSAHISPVAGSVTTITVQVFYSCDNVKWYALGGTFTDNALATPSGISALLTIPGGALYIRFNLSVYSCAACTATGMYFCIGAGK